MTVLPFICPTHTPLLPVTTGYTKFDFKDLINKSQVYSIHTFYDFKISILSLLMFIFSD